MFLFSCEKLTFHQTSGVNQADKSDGNADTRCSLYYFNAAKGYWEPAIERFSIVVLLQRAGKMNIQNVKLLDPINVNVSVYLGGVINDFLKLWENSTKKALLFQKKMAKGHESVLRATDAPFRSRTFLMGSQNVMLMDTAEALVDCVTPYAIRNLTDRSIKVASLRQGSDIQDNECKIKQGEIKGLAVNFSDTLNMSE